MKKANMDGDTDDLLSIFGAATAIRLSVMVEGDVRHGQITRFLPVKDDTSKDLWQQVKKVVRSVKQDDEGLLGSAGGTLDVGVCGVASSLSKGLEWGVL